MSVMMLLSSLKGRDSAGSYDRIAGATRPGSGMLGSWFGEGDGRPTNRLNARMQRRTIINREVYRHGVHTDGAAAETLADGLDERWSIGALPSWKVVSARGGLLG